MPPKIEWPEFPADATPIEQLCLLSRYYGSDPEMVLAGGGNTSVKIGDRLHVKASGCALATMTPDGLVEMDRAKLAAIVDAKLPEDSAEREEQFKQLVLAARLHPGKGQRPSVECALHNLLPAKYVVHTHCTVANMLTCSKGGEAVARELFGDDVIWIPYVDPGYVLAQVLAQALRAWSKATGKPYPTAVFMDNHGLIVCGETPQEVKDRTDLVLEKLHARTAAAGTGPAFGDVQRLLSMDARKIVKSIAPALRALLAEGDCLKVVTFDDSEPAMALVGGAAGREAALAGPLTPDQIVYCTSYPLWLEAKPDEAPEVLVERLRAEIAAHKEQRGAAPKVVLVKGVGLFAAGDDFAAAHTTRSVYLDAIKVMVGATRLGGIDYLTDAQRVFIEEWEVESYRKKVSAGERAAGRAAGKVIVVTGAAQGFGLGIAESLAEQGAYVILADMNAEGARKAAHALAQRVGPGRALGVAVNVADADSVDDATFAVLRLYGGFDAFIANAGVLKAESMKTQSLKDFQFVTSVNYAGYFVTAQAAARVMAVQNLARPDLWFDIIQINSKSGLQGSNKNAAYAGGKFGGIGLTQSFALELVEDGIKVNSVCPGNFFDGPLWSDPEKGLFVQYLNSGKVPGAKTIDDVKKFYEAKVPMRRGCTVPDVVRAILYIIEQQYETGQAVPVTGGQVMLK